jgi:programmed cell death 6-interacting protein
MSHMISVDKKKTSQVTYEKQLKKWIEKQENCNVADFQETLNELDRLREEVRNVVEKTDSALNVHYKYVALLSSLEKRVPITEQEVRIQFCWYDIFKQKRASLYNIHFEKVNVLFNIGAIMSQIALQQNRALDDGIKICSKYLQNAAGVFTQVREELEKHPEVAVCLDLTTDCLNFLINLMLAQAQECFYEKAVNANMKSGVLTKLAAQVSEYYEICYNLATTTNLKNVIHKKWITCVNLKMAGFKALAYYEESKKLKINEEFGQQVGYLRVAYQSLLNAAKDNKSPPPELFEWFGQVVSKVENELNSAEKENSQIYHEIVPLEHQLKPPEKQSMVKAVPLDKEKFTLTVDPFATLVPTSVKKAESLYSERKSEMLREITKEVENHNETVKNALSSMGLPGAIQATENPYTIPQSLIEKMKVVQSEGGLKFLEDQIKNLDRLAQQASTLLTETLTMLDQEEADDNEMRVKFKDKWTRTPSHILTVNLRQELQKHKGNLEHARKSDQFILSKLEAHRDGISKLTWTREQMSAALPTPSLLIDNNNDNKMPSLLNALKEKLQQLDTLLFNRENLLKELREMISKDEIADKILKLAENEYETTIAQELQKYNPLLVKIRSTFTEQETLLKSIVEQNQKFQEERKMNDELTQRQKILNQLDQAFTHYIQLKAYLTEGIQFYTKFQDILKTLKDSCSDFVLARQTEKQDLMEDIKSSSTNVNTPFTAASTSGSTSFSSLPVSSSSLSPLPSASLPPLQPQIFMQPQYYQGVAPSSPSPQSAGPFYIAYTAFQQQQQQQQPSNVHSVSGGFMQSGSIGYQQPRAQSSFQTSSFGVIPQQQYQQQHPPPPYPGYSKGYPGNRY